MNGTTGSHRLPQQRARRQAGVLAAAVAAVAVLAAACGSGGPSPAAPSHPAGYQRYHAYSACMRSQGAPFWPEPSQVPQGVWDNPNTYEITLDGGLHSPDFTTIGLDPHTLRSQVAAQACGMGLVWQVVWWWPAGAPQPGPAGLGPARSVRQ